jgi:hypothetical protein
MMSVGSGEQPACDELPSSSSWPALDMSSDRCSLTKAVEVETFETLNPEPLNLEPDTIV